MNKYIKQLISMYEAKNLWDIRARNACKTMLIPVKDWLDVFNNYDANNLARAYCNFGSYTIQGLATKDSKYVLYESTPRYNNVAGYGCAMTFITIAEFGPNDTLGVSKDYQYIYNVLSGVTRTMFSNYHTYLSYVTLKGYDVFSDITDYTEFVSRYIGLNGATLCENKQATQAINVKLQRRLNEESDFKYLDWEVYHEDNNFKNLFYHSPDVSYTTEHSNIWLDGGILG